MKVRSGLSSGVRRAHPTSLRTLPSHPHRGYDCPYTLAGWSGLPALMPSQQVVFQVAHAISGRIRLKIPRLRTDLDFRYRVKVLMEAVQGVDEVCLNPEAQSIIVHYDPKALPPATVQARLSPIIQRAAHRESPGQPGPGGVQPGDRLAVKFDNDLTLYGSATLTHYEQEQVEEISLWLSDMPGGLDEGIGRVFDTVESAVEELIPDGVVQKVLQSLQTVADDWQADWQSLKSAAGVEDYRQLKQAELDFCDKLADGVRKKAIATGAVKGSLGDFAGVLGEGFSLPLSVLLALQTAHRIGLCYGYSPETKDDRQLAWVILALGTATTPEDKRAAVKAWRDCHLLLYPQILKDLLEKPIAAATVGGMLGSLARQVVGRVIEKESGGMLPVVGPALSAWGEISLLEGGCLAARRVFQVRWLTDNEKLEPGSAKDKKTGK